MKRSDNVLRLVVRLALIAIFWLAGLGILLDRERSLVLASGAVSGVAESAAQQVRLQLDLDAGAFGDTPAPSARLGPDGAVLVETGGGFVPDLRIDAASLLARLRFPGQRDQTMRLAPDQPLVEPGPLQRVWLATIGPPWIVSVAKVPGTDFSVVVRRSRDEALFDRRQRARSFALLAFLLAAVIEMRAGAWGGN